MGQQSECLGRRRIEEVAREHCVASTLKTADTRSPLSATEPGVNPDTGFGESELGAAGTDPVVTC